MPIQTFAHCRRLFGREGRFSVNDAGATAVEYALLVALIAATIIGIVIIFGVQVRDAYDTVIGEF